MYIMKLNQYMICIDNVTIEKIDDAMYKPSIYIWIIVYTCLSHVYTEIQISVLVYAIRKHVTDTASPPLSRRPIPRSPPLPSPPSQTPFPGMFLRDPATRYWRVCQLGAAAATGPGPPALGRSGRTGPRERGIETLCAEAPAFIQSTDTVEPNPGLRRDL
jgi:hypothetical protein